MPKYELIKLIEAQKLNPRTGIPTTDPLLTIPFGGIIEDITPDRDMDKFVYLGQRYQCAHDILESAISLIDAPAAPPPQSPAATGAQTVAAKAAAAAAAEAATVAPGDPVATSTAQAPKLVWEPLHSTLACSRARVLGGWLVAAGGGVTFYPDLGHEWDGGSLP